MFDSRLLHWNNYSKPLDFQKLADSNRVPRVPRWRWALGGSLLQQVKPQDSLPARHWHCSLHTWHCRSEQSQCHNVLLQTRRKPQLCSSFNERVPVVQSTKILPSERRDKTKWLNCIVLLIVLLISCLINLCINCIEFRLYISSSYCN